MRPDHPILAHRENLKRAGKPGPWIALFDIDSTLIDTAPRNFAILEAALSGIPDLEPWRNKVAPHSQDWGILEPLRRAGIDDQILFQKVEAFWEERFFSDEWLVHDRPYPGVAAFLWDLKAEGFRLAYLTGRHASGMERGTKRNFQDQGLPSGPDDVFLFKPTIEMEDREFKASLVRPVSQMGTLVAAMDNEPANVNLFRSGFPDARVFWIDTLTSPDPERLIDGIDRIGLDFFLT